MPAYFQTNNEDTTRSDIEPVNKSRMPKQHKKSSKVNK
jgi:hypothetical protein